MVNNLRYGFIRQGYADRGTTNHDYSRSPTWIPLAAGANGATYPTGHNNVPVHNAVDDLTLVKGRHTIQVGANYRAMYNNRTTDSTAYKYADVNYQLLTVGSIAGTGSSLDPGRSLSGRRCLLQDRLQFRRSPMPPASSRTRWSF